jgi:hypothetical protein
MVGSAAAADLALHRVKLHSRKRIKDWGKAFM